MKDIPNGLNAILPSLHLPAWQYYPEVTSTNDLALAWARQGAVDGSLIIADSQTAGRGRDSRQWMTFPGTALALSLILQPTPEEMSYLPRFTALAALALISALEELGIPAEIKWPNDVLVQGKKIAGILIEVDWQQDQVAALVVGLGVNVAAESIPPASQIRFPATSVETEWGQKVDRWELLATILHDIQHHRAYLPSESFLLAWNKHLAFKGQKIRFRLPIGKVITATIQGINPDGQLGLLTTRGKPITAVAGEIEIIHPEDSAEHREI